MSVTIAKSDVVVDLQELNLKEPLHNFICQPPRPEPSKIGGVEGAGLGFIHKKRRLSESGRLFLLLIFSK
jgi:hypothetical protein